VYRKTTDLVNELSRPRSLFITKSNEVFCLERAGSYEEWETLFGYVVVYDDNGMNDGTAQKNATILVNMTALDHGLWVTDTHIYASNARGVYRWPYEPGQRTPVNPDSIEVVVKDIPAPSDQLHPTRTILIDNKNEMLFLSTGSEQNIVLNNTRANIYRYNLTSIPNGGFRWGEDGELVAAGVRNTVGMSLDKFGVLWGVDNSYDSAYRASLGGDINENNPADELNRFTDFGQSYGYPYCFTEYILPDGVGMGTGTQWVLENFTDQYSDDYCRSGNVTLPKVALQAHSAPLGIEFYHHQEAWPDDCPAGVALPKEWDGHAFITYHGSYYRNEPIGAKVMRIPMTKHGQVDGAIDLVPHVVMEDMDNGARVAVGNPSR
jgi:glucose/arabinose dehydrogenase